MTDNSKDAILYDFFRELFNLLLNEMGLYHIQEELGLPLIKSPHQLPSSLLKDCHSFKQH